MDQALSDITNHTVTVYRAARQYGIPETTLRRHLKQPQVLKVGKPTVLSEREENEIVEICQLFSEWGFKLTKLEITNVVAEFYKT